jgi:hypothetical protein
MITHKTGKHWILLNIAIPGIYMKSAIRDGTNIYSINKKIGGLSSYFKQK